MRNWQNDDFTNQSASTRRVNGLTKPLKTLSSGPSALHLSIGLRRFHGASPARFRGICDEARIERAFGPFHPAKKAAPTRIESADSALDISLGRSPRNRPETKEPRAVSPPDSALKQFRSAPAVYSFNQSPGSVDFLRALIFLHSRWRAALRSPQVNCFVHFQSAGNLHSCSRKPPR